MRVAVLLAIALAALAVSASPAAADSSFGELGSAAGQIANAQKIAVSRQSGDVYVADSQNGRVDEFHSDGSFVRAFGWGVRNGAAELQTCTVLTGCRPGLIEGTGAGELSTPSQIAVDNDPASPSYGEIWVTDGNNETHRVEKFTADGAFVLMVGGEVDKTTGANLCTAADLAGGDICGGGVAGSGPGHFQSHVELAPIAVGPGGVLFDGDVGRVEEFEPSGAFRGEFALHDATMPVSALAVDSACAQHEPPLTALTTPSCSEYDSSDGDVYVHQGNGVDRPHEEVPGVQKYSSTGAELETIDATGRAIDSETEGLPFPARLATDAAGHLYVGEDAELEYEVLDYTPTGVLFADFSSPQIRPHVLGSIGKIVTPHFVSGIAVGQAVGELYAINPYKNEISSNAPEFQHIAAVDLPRAGPPQVKPGSEHADEIEPTTATLHAVVNPEGHPTEYSFQLIGAKQCAENEAASHDCFEGPETTPSTPGTLPLTIKDDSVQAGVSGLAPETAYRFRAVALSHCNEAEPLEACKAFGETAEFTTLPPVGIRDLATQTVAPEEVTFKAEISPDNGTRTEYEFCLGEEAGVYPRCAGHPLEGASGNEFKEVTASFEHLKPNAEYHYRLTAHNSYGIGVHSSDQAFTTEETSAEENTRAGCGNQLLREENGSTALPDCRAYERVSPADKGGSAVEPINALSPDGQRASFETPVAFGGAESGLATDPYVANRTEAGWESQAVLTRPAPGYQDLPVIEFDAGLDRWLFTAVPAGTHGEAEERGVSSFAFALGRYGAAAQLASPGLATSAVGGSGVLEAPQGMGHVVAASSDFSSFYYATWAPQLPTDHRSPESTPIDRIYQINGADGPSPTLKLSAELPLSISSAHPDECRLDLGVALSGGSPLLPVASPDGSALFYTAPTQANAECKSDGSGPNKSRLFARTGSASPVLISTDPPALCHAPAPCSSASPENVILWAIAPDAREAWFTTTQPLVDSDTDTTEDLYLAKLTAAGQLESLVQASAGEADVQHANPGEGADVKGVLGVSKDSTLSYFVASGVLTEAPNQNGGSGETAAKGAENLYAYDSGTGTTKFVARLCSQAGRSGEVQDPACPQALTAVEAQHERLLWESSAEFGPGSQLREADLTPDGRYLVFASYARLTPDDTDEARDVYRYDFQTGKLIRLSFGRRGNDGNGNDNAYDAELPEINGGPAESQPGNLDVAAEDYSRSISENGSVVVFRTAAPLVSADTDTGAHPGCGFQTTGCDVYEWEEDGHGTCREAGGCVSLLSSGLDPYGTFGGLIDSSGKDITFITSRGLIPSDDDGERDLYDARVGGGFPPSPPPEPCKVGGDTETCHGQGTGQAIRPSYTSEETHHGPEAEPRPPKCAKGRDRVKKHGQIRCVPNKSKKHHKAKHHKKHRRVNTKPRAAK